MLLAWRAFVYWIEPTKGSNGQPISGSVVPALNAALLEQEAEPGLSDGPSSAQINLQTTVKHRLQRRTRYNWAAVALALVVALPFLIAACSVS